MFGRPSLNFLNDADEFYKTIGLIEYIGQAYPQDDIVDAEMVTDLAELDLSEIADDPATLLWDQTARYFGYVEGFKRDDKVTQVYQPHYLWLVG